MCLLSFFFFNDTATTEIYTLSLHDALPIFGPARAGGACLKRRRSGRFTRRHAERIADAVPLHAPPERDARDADRKSTRLNSSHLVISYAVFCLKKKKHDSRVRTTMPYNKSI